MNPSLAGKTLLMAQPLESSAQRQTLLPNMAQTSSLPGAWDRENRVGWARQSECQLSPKQSDKTGTFFGGIREFK
jgi:hypothetical protein